MEFKVPEFVTPDFSEEKFKNAKDITLHEVEKDGVAPDDFYLTRHMPTFYKVEGEWQLPEHTSINCVAVLEDGKVIVKEIRELEKGDKVVISEDGKTEDGIYVYNDAFPKDIYSKPGKAVETSFSHDYDYLFELLQHERDSEDGYIVWVLGPSVVFD